MELNQTDISYSMYLADGQEWCIGASGDLIPWIERLSSLMELKPNRSNQSEGTHRLFFVKMTPLMKDNLSKQGWKYYNLRPFRFWYHSDAKSVICAFEGKNPPEKNIVQTWKALLPIYQKVISFGGLPLHAALIERDGLGFLLAGPGNIGKSTCCCRIPLPWNAMCDDETLVVRKRKERYFVHPLPTWSNWYYGYTKATYSTQKHFTLAAIFFIEQAEINEVIHIGRGQTTMRIIKSFMQTNYFQSMSMNNKYYLNLKGPDRKNKIDTNNKLFDNATELAANVPAYVLKVSLRGHFWEEMEKVLERLKL